MTDEQDEDGPGPYLPPGTQVRYDGLGEEYGPEYGVVIHCWLDDEMGGHDCYVAFFGGHQPSGELREAPYILRYAAASLVVLGPDHVAKPHTPPPSGEPVFSTNLRRCVESEFGSGRGRGLRSVRWALERRSDGPDPRWRGDVINLRLDQATNFLTVSLEVDDEDDQDDAIAPEVVDYGEFKRFVLRLWP